MAGWTGIGRDEINWNGNISQSGPLFSNSPPNYLITKEFLDSRHYVPFDADLQSVTLPGLGELTAYYLNAIVGVGPLSQGDDTNHIYFQTYEVLTTDCFINLDVGDSSRTLSFVGDPTLGDWFDQSVKSTASPTFANGVVSTQLLVGLSSDFADGYGPHAFVVSGPNAKNIFAITNAAQTVKSSMYIDSGATTPMQFGTITNHNFGFFTNNGSPQFVMQTDGGVSMPNYSSHGWIYCPGTAKTQVQLNASGSYYGTIQNDSSGTWSLGFKTTSGNGLGTAAFTWTATGDMTLNPAGNTIINNMVYGSMYGDNITQSVTISAVDTHYEVGGSMSGGTCNGFTFQNSKELKALVAGKYKVDYSISVTTASANQEIETSVMINSTAQTVCTAHSENITANKPINLGGTGILTLAVNDVVKFCVANHTATNNVTVNHANITLLRVDN